MHRPGCYTTGSRRPVQVPSMDHRISRGGGMYAVVLHPSGNSYVVRSEWAINTRDYRNAIPVKWYKRESSAQKYADKLNGHED